LYENQQPCTVVNSFNHINEQITDKVKLFSPTGTDIDKLKFQIRSVSQNSMNYLSRVYDEIPNEISLYDVGIDFIDYSPNYFKMDIDGDYDLASIIYIYQLSNFASWPSFWIIYQKPNLELDYTLPIIPSSVLELEYLPITQNNINNPKELNAQFYKFYTDENYELFDKAPVNGKIRCLEHQIKSESVDF